MQKLPQVRGAQWRGEWKAGVPQKEDLSDLLRGAEAGILSSEKEPPSELGEKGRKTSIGGRGLRPERGRTPWS